MTLILEKSDPKSRTRYRSPNGKNRPYLDKGRWKLVSRHVLPNGEVIKVIGSGRTQRDCITNTEKLIEKRIRQSKNDHRGQLFIERCDMWIEAKRSLSQLRYKTIEGYSGVLRLHITPYFKDKEISEISRQHLQMFYAKLIKEGKTYSTLKEVRAVMLGVFKEALNDGEISFNCARDIQLPPKPKLKPTYFTPGEVARILVVARQKNEYLIWAIAFFLGPRQGERLALSWSGLDLNAEPPILKVSQSVQRQKGKGLVLVAPKNESSIREYPIPEQLISELKALKAEQNAMSLSSPVPWNKYGLIFPTIEGTPIDPSNDRKKWKLLLQEAGVPYRKLHAARHTTATLMHASGVDLLSISHVLGHSSIHTTAEFYAHVPNETKAKAISTLIEAINT
jgi:integrase